MFFWHKAKNASLNKKKIKNIKLADTNAIFRGKKQLQSKLITILILVARCN